MGQINLGPCGGVTRSVQGARPYASIKAETTIFGGTHLRIFRVCIFGYTVYCCFITQKKNRLLMIRVDKVIGALEF